MPRPSPKPNPKLLRDMHDLALHPSGRASGTGDACLFGLSLCSGAGGLDLGLAIAIPGYRAVGHVERETLSYDFPRLLCDKGAAAWHGIYAGQRRGSDRGKPGASPPRRSVIAPVFSSVLNGYPVLGTG